MKISNIKTISLFVRYLTLLFCISISSANADQAHNKIALMKTSMGDIEIELFEKRAPTSVKNFINYINSGFYTNTLFHRVIPNFMVQAGGFDENFNKKKTKTPIVNEANAYVPNLRGTLSMARTNDPHSATSQFFINVVDNSSLDKAGSNPGYAVFGKVVKGMEIADKIAKSKTKTQGRMRDVPSTPILIKSVVIKEAIKAAIKTPSKT